MLAAGSSAGPSTLSVSANEQAVTCSRVAAAPQVAALQAARGRSRPWHSWRCAFWLQLPWQLCMRTPQPNRNHCFMTAEKVDNA